MTQNSFRFALALILAASLAIRLQTVREMSEARGNFNLIGTFAEALPRHGLKLLKNPNPPPRISSAFVYFGTPDCDRPSIAAAFAIHNDLLPTLHNTAGRGYRHTIYFLDHRWPEQNRLALHAVWLENLWWSLVRSSGYLPVNLALVIARPESCPSASEIDWSPLWSRDKFLESRNPGRLAAAVN